MEVKETRQRILLARFASNNHLICRTRRGALPTGVHDSWEKRLYRREPPIIPGPIRPLYPPIMP